MRADSTTRERVFRFTDISEDEAVVLRTLLNLSEKGVRKRLEADEGYWEHRLDEDEAVEIGNDLVERILGEIDRHPK